MNKINIFWIEDNPKPKGFTSIESYVKHSLPKSSLFNLYLFQHPIEVFEYIDLKTKIEKKFKRDIFEKKCPEVLPDIIVFDYRLSDNFLGNKKDSFYYRKKSDLEFIKKKSANLVLRNAFRKDLFSGTKLFCENENLITGNSKRLEKDLNFYKENFATIQIKDDEEQFGLYCGLSLLDNFRNYSTHAVPATKNFSDEDKLTSTSKFYKWISGVSRNKSLNNTNIEIKSDWSDLLSIALPGLRERLLFQVNDKVLFPNFTDINEILKDIEKGIGLEKKTISFNTVYGIKKYSISSLFWDVKNNKEEIKSFCKKIIKSYPFEEYNGAKEKAELLIRAYKSSDTIKARHLLSKKIVEYCNEEIKITNSELKRLAGEFGLSELNLKKYKSDPNNSGNIKLNPDKCIEYRLIKKGKDNRLLVLFTDIHIHYLRQEFLKINKFSDIGDDVVKILNSKPNTEDLFAALFPIPYSPLVLPYDFTILKDQHLRVKKNGPFEAWKSHLSTTKNMTSPIFSASDYPRNLTIPESQLSKLLAIELGLEINNYPNWLKI